MNAVISYLRQSESIRSKIFLQNKYMAYSIDGWAICFLCYQDFSSVKPKKWQLYQSI